MNVRHLVAAAGDIASLGSSPAMASAPGRLCASLLSAQARGATIQVQLWGVVGGYMKLDRIWVFK